MFSDRSVSYYDLVDAFLDVRGFSRGKLLSCVYKVCSSVLSDDDNDDNNDRLVNYYDLVGFSRCLCRCRKRFKSKVGFRRVHA